MTEEEAREVIVTPEMLRVGWSASEEIRIAARDCYDEYDGLRAAFPTMLRVWLEQGAPGWSALRGSSAVAR